MNRGVSLHVGVRQYKPRYADAANLKSCHNDARAMLEFAQKLGYESLGDRSNLLLDPSATVPAVLDYIEDATRILKRGDAFFLTFSGHGSQLKDTPADLEALIERDGLDEVFCLYDDPLVDDIVYGYLAKFRLGVRVFAVIDSCNSGSRAELFRSKQRKLHTLDPLIQNEQSDPPPSANGPASGTKKTIRREIVQRMLDDPDDFPNDFISDLREKYSDSCRTELKALVAIYTACQSDQTTPDGEENGFGLFTQKFLDTWTGNQSCYQLDRALKQAAPVHGDVVPDFKYFKPWELRGEHFLRRVPFVI